jgi:NAD(P)-dependent dehydrogenase (short-subunit alcohol dehydrogenase family)
LKGKEPKIVNVSSEAGRRSSVDSLRGDPSYALSKYAFNGLTRLWSHELKGKVAVNSMHPGWVRSDMGGPQAHDDLETGRKRIFEAASQPASRSNEFWYGLESMEW